MADTDRGGGQRRGGLVERADVVARLAARESATAVLASELRAGARQVDARTEAPAVADPDVVPFTPIRPPTLEAIVLPQTADIVAAAAELLRWS